MHGYTFQISTLPLKLGCKCCFQLGSQVFKVTSRKCLGKNVCCLENCWSVNQWNRPFFYFLLNKMTIYFHMLVQSWWTEFLAIFMVAWLLQNIFIEYSTGMLSSFKSLFNHIPSQIPYVITLSSAFALLRAITNCFLFFQVTKFPHTWVQYVSFFGWRLFLMILTLNGKKQLSCIVTTSKLLILHTILSNMIVESMWKLIDISSKRSWKITWFVLPMFQWKDN